MSSHENVLAASGLPSFFRLRGVDRESLPAPRNPYGQSIRVWARSLSVMQKEAVVLSSATGAAWRLASDEGPYLDGFDAAPCPLAFMSTGMVSSFMSEMLVLARDREIDLRDLELVQDNYYTMAGSALRGTMMGGALPIELEARIDSHAPDSDLHRLVTDAVHASPIAGLIGGVHRSAFSLRRNGRKVDLERVARAPALDAPDPGGTVAMSAAVATTPDSTVIERVTAAASIEGVAGGAHTSLAETQQRRLHLRVTCRQRSDELLEIEQRLFSPLGSTFRFRCDPAGTAAPDPATCIAAGIAFCFMTQLGRYAKIVRKSLDAYNVIQDLHLPRIGGHHADPVETHVYLTTNEDDDFARRAVEMGEQTCFLHAFCRSALSVESRITRT